MMKKPRELSKTNVIYHFQCKKGDCEHLHYRSTAYRGLTTNTLSQGLSFHLQNGAIKKHSEAKHPDQMINRKEIERFTKVMYVERDVYRLEILEALLINAEDFEINRQDTGRKRILKLYGDNRHVPGVRNMVQNVRPRV